MALLPNVFVPEEAEDATFSIIPQQWLPAEIVKSELKVTKDKQGKYIALKFKVIEGEFDGRFLFSNLNIINKSEMAVRIANSDLKAICAAVGFEGDLEDTVDLHNIPMEIKVTVKAETSNWPAKNEIKGYRVWDEEDPMS